MGSKSEHNADWCFACLQVKQVRIEYEYKLMLQPQQLNEQLREANTAREAAEQARNDATAELNILKANAADAQDRFLADMEAQHAAATEQLEAAYDNRFAVCFHHLCQGCMKCLSLCCMSEMPLQAKWRYNGTTCCAIQLRGLAHV